jgi:hypothetical protein
MAKRISWGTHLRSNLRNSLNPRRSIAWMVRTIWGVPDSRSVPGLTRCRGLAILIARLVVRVIIVRVPIMLVVITVPKARSRVHRRHIRGCIPRHWNGQGNRQYSRRRRLVCISRGRQRQARHRLNEV